MIYVIKYSQINDLSMISEAEYIAAAAETMYLFLPGREFRCHSGRNFNSGNTHSRDCRSFPAPIPAFCTRHKFHPNSWGKRARQSTED